MRGHPGNVYWIGGVDSGPIKVGWSSHHPGQRIGEMQTGNPSRLNLFGFVPGPMDLERDCHRYLAEWLVRGEWFLREPALGLLIELGRVEDFDYEKDGWRVTA